MNKKHKQVTNEDFVDLPNGEDVCDDTQPKADEVQIEVDQDEKEEISEQVLEENIEKQKKKIDEVEQAVSKQNSRKKKIWNWVFFAINIVVVACVLFYQLSQEKVVAPVGLKIYILPLICLIATFLLANVSESFGISYLVKRNIGKWKYGLSYKVNAIGRYYDAITPLATGGQPFQITYLKNHEVPLHCAMSIPLAKMVFHQICWILISFVCLIISFAMPKYNTFVSVASVMGFVLGSALLFLIVFLSVSRSVGRKLVVGVLKLLQKMHIIKNYEKQYEKIMKTIEDYQSVMRQYAKSPRDLIIILLTYFVKLCATYILPYLVYAMYNGFDSSLFFDFFEMSVLIDLAAGFFPLPGGTGMSELSFSAMFGAYFSGGTLFWALITWRIFSYYFYLLQGITIISYDMFYGNRKYKW